MLLFILLSHITVTFGTLFSNSGANSEVSQVLEKHNDLRRRVAKGLVIGSNSELLPKATNMYALVWDEALAKVASDYADTCPGTNNHNTNRVTDATTAVDNGIGSIQQYSASNGVGENMGFSTASYSISLITDTLLQSMLDDEAKYYTYGTSYNGDCTPAGKSCGHFTQGVWADTIYVGCGYKTGCSPTWTTQLVCNFYPAGNVGAAEIYTACPSATTCDASNGWCIGCASCDNNGLCTPTPYPTKAPTIPAPTNSPVVLVPNPSCLTLSNYALSGFNGEYSKVSDDYNGKPYYSKSCGSITCYLEYNPYFNSGVYLLLQDHGTFNYHGWCTATTDNLVDCTEGKLIYKYDATTNYLDSDARIDVSVC